MPKVPTYDGPQIQQAGLPSGTLNVQPADFSVIGRSISKVSGDVADIFGAEFNRANDAALNQAHAEAEKITTKALYGDESRLGVMQMEGGDLFGKAGKIRQDYSNSINQIGESLGSKQAKAQFEKSKLGYLTSFDRHLQQRIGVQRERTNTESYNQWLDSSTNRLSMDLASAPLPKFEDGGYDISSIADIFDRASLAAHQQANDPLSSFPDATRSDTTKRLTKESHAKILHSIMPILIEKNPTAADMVFKAYGENSANKSQILQSLENAKFADRAQQMADDAISSGSMKTGYDPVLSLGPDSVTQTRQGAVDVITARSEDQKLKDEAIRRVDHYFERQKMNSLEWDHNTSNELSAKIQSREIGSQTQLASDSRFYALGEGTRARLLSMFSKDENAANPEIIDALHQLATRDRKSQDDLLKLTPSEGKMKLEIRSGDGSLKPLYVDYFSQKEYETFIKLRDEIAKARNGEPTQLNRTRSTEDIVSDLTKKMTFNTNQAFELRQRLEEETQVAQNAKRAPLNATEIQDIANQLSTNIYEKKPYWIDPAKRVFEIPLNELTNREKVFYVPLSEIPVYKQQQIKAELERSGKTVKNEDIEKFYAEKLVAARIMLNTRNR